MISNTANKKSKDAIKRKITRNARKRTLHTHLRATLIRPTKVIIKSRDAIKRRAIGNGTLTNYAQINGKAVTIAYKSNTIKLKLDEDPLQRWIYFLTFIESLEMIFSEYKETCEVLLDYATIGGEDIK